MASPAAERRRSDPPPYGSARSHASGPSPSPRHPKPRENAWQEGAEHGHGATSARPFPRAGRSAPSAPEESAVPTFHEASGGLTYSLSAVTSASNLLHPARAQAGVARLGAAAFTKTALDGGRTMGLTTAEMLAVIASLSRASAGCRRSQGWAHAGLLPPCASLPDR